MERRTHDELRTFAAALARWRREEMDPDTQDAFRASGLGDEVTRLGFALDEPEEADETAKLCVLS